MFPLVTFLTCTPHYWSWCPPVISFPFRCLLDVLNGPNVLHPRPLKPLSPHIQVIKNERSCGGAKLCLSFSSSTSVALSSDLIDQLVSRVTVEVTKQISSLLPSSLSVPALQHNSPPLTEVSVMDLAGSVAPTSQANAVVQDVIHQTHVALTGEPGVTPSSNLPSELFTSVSIPFDAQVRLKLKSKIWNQEHIDFGNPLVNPTLEGKF